MNNGKNVFNKNNKIFSFIKFVNEKEVNALKTIKTSNQNNCAINTTTHDVIKAIK